MTKAYNHRLVSGILCYTIDEICNLFKDKKLHPQTVRTWINDGLSVCVTGSPNLIHGADLIAFLKKRNSERRIKMDFGEFFCMSCKLPHTPFAKNITIEQHDRFIRAFGLCPRTKTKMCKTYKIDDYGRLAALFTFVDCKRLLDLSSPRSGTQLSNNTKMPEIDSEKSSIQLEMTL